MSVLVLTGLSNNVSHVYLCFLKKNLALCLSNVRIYRSSNQEAYLKNNQMSSFLFVRLRGVKNAVLIKMSSFVGTFQKLIVYKF